jgi:hypothetical protein
VAGFAVSARQALRTVVRILARNPQALPGARPSWLSAAVDDDPARRIVRRQGDRDLISQHHTDAVLAQLASEMREDLVTILDLNAEVTRGKDFNDASLELYVLFSTHGARVS